MPRIEARIVRPPVRVNEIAVEARPDRRRPGRQPGISSWTCQSISASACPVAFNHPKTSSGSHVPGMRQPQHHRPIAAHNLDRIEPVHPLHEHQNGRGFAAKSGGDTAESGA